MRLDRDKKKYVAEHVTNPCLHHIDATQRDGRRPGLRVQSVHGRALQPLDPAGSLPHYEHRLIS